MIKKTSSVIILNRKMQILLMLRDDKPGILYPGLWGFIGGHAKAGEKPLDTATREVKEETGLKITKSRFRELVSIKTQTKIREIFLVRGGWKNSDVIRGEGQKISFISLSKIDLLPMSSYHRFVLTLLREYLKKNRPN